MKSTDLRIGNWVMGIGYMRVTELKNELGNKFITASNEDIVFMDEEDNFEPIELTEDVLSKIGFKKNSIYGSVIEYFPIDDNLASIFCTKEKQNIRIQVVRKNAYETIAKYIKYLHELQNAYYCLTNKELEVKL